MLYDHAVKTLLLLTTLAIGLASSGFSESSQEAAVRAAHEDFLKAAKAGDGAALNKIFADGLQYSHSSAKLENKQEAIAALVKAPGNFEIHSQTIHVYGKAATIRAKMTAHGANGDIPLAMLMVWVKNGANWQLVERHTTRIPAP
jgi:ketosteroid isomerase-like protein